MEKDDHDREALMADIDGIFTKLLGAGQHLLRLDDNELTEQVILLNISIAAVRVRIILTVYLMFHIDGTILFSASNDSNGSIENAESNVAFGLRC